MLTLLCSTLEQGKRNETAMKEAYIAELKEQYRQRMERSMSVDARPWRKYVLLYACCGGVTEVWAHQSMRHSFDVF